jgi:hypothetical protein
VLPAGAAAAGSHALAISGPPTLGGGDTLAIGLSAPTSSLEVAVPPGYVVPGPSPGGGVGHARLEASDGSTARGEVVATSEATGSCEAVHHDAVWRIDLDGRAPAFVLVAGQRLTFCAVPADAAELVLTTKPWRSPTVRGDYVWRAGFADGAEATAVERLPVRLTLAVRARVLVRGALTANAVPIAGRRIDLVDAARRSIASATTRGDGTFGVRVAVRRTTTVYAVTHTGGVSGESYVVRSNRVTIRLPSRQ